MVMFHYHPTSSIEGEMGGYETRAACLAREDRCENGKGHLKKLVEAGSALVG